MLFRSGPVFKQLPDAQQPPPDAGAASPSVQPAPAPEVAPKPQDGPSIVKTDPLLRTGAGVASGAKWAAKHAPVTAAAAAAALGGLGYGLGLFGGGRQSAPGQQPQPGSRPPVQINILPREALRQLEQPRRPQSAPMQAPAPQPGLDRSTDIIRQLSGRMA